MDRHGRRIPSQAHVVCLNNGAGAVSSLSLSLSLHIFCSGRPLQKRKNFFFFFFCSFISFGIPIRLVLQETKADRADFQHSYDTLGLWRFPSPLRQQQQQQQQQHWWRSAQETDEVFLLFLSYISGSALLRCALRATDTPTQHKFTHTHTHKDAVFCAVYGFRSVLNKKKKKQRQRGCRRGRTRTA